MNIKKKSITSFIVTLLLLILGEIVLSTALPVLNLAVLRFPLHIIVALYLILYVNTSVISLMILLVEMVHSSFSLDLWSYGTFAGVLLSVLINRFKSMFDVGKVGTRIFLGSGFYFLWNFITNGMEYLKLGMFLSWGENGYRVFFEWGIFLIMLIPIFTLLDRVWAGSTNSEEVVA